MNIQVLATLLRCPHQLCCVCHLQAYFAKESAIDGTAIQIASLNLPRCTLVTALRSWDMCRGTKKLVFLSPGLCAPQLTCQHHTSHSSAPHKSLAAMPITRWKKFKYKENKVIKPPKTSRTEISPEMRAFLCGAIIGMRGAYASLTDLANQVNRDQSGIFKLYKRVTKKAEELSIRLWDEVLYENNLGRMIEALNSGTEGRYYRACHLLTR
jgi:hypothetical protein